MQALELWAPERRALLCRLEMEEGEVFHLEHRNSIYLAPVRETYRVEAGGRMRQTGLESPSAGVFEYYGFDPPREGRVDLWQTVGPIRMRSMSYEHHRLLTGGRVLALRDLARPGEPLTLGLTES